MLSLDEKSQIQALDRTQAGLPIKKGPCPYDDARKQSRRSEYFSAAQHSRQFQHGSGAGTAVVGTDKVLNSHRIVVRGIKNDASPIARDLRDDVPHGQIAQCRRPMKIVFLYLASVTLELSRDVFLRLVDRL